MSKRPLIIDCDPGTDDAQCIMMLAASGLFDIKGITATHGNVPLSMTSVNALYLAHLLGIDCPVYKGAEQALIMRLPRAENVHGAGGLGGYEFSAEGLEFASGKARDFLYETAVECDGELEICAIGPLTNLAITVMKHPDFPSLVKKLVIMGGARTEGNMTPLAEFNVYQDPHACEIVLQAGFKDFVVVDYQACKTAYLDRAEQEKICNVSDKNTFAPLLKAYMKHRDNSIKEAVGTVYEEKFARMAEKMVFCDAAAAAVLIDESVATYQPVYMMCETQGEKTMGCTVIDKYGLSGMTNVKLCVGLDRDKYAKMYFDCLEKYEV